MEAIQPKLLEQAVVGRQTRFLVVASQLPHSEELETKVGMATRSDKSVEDLVRRVEDVVFDETFDMLDSISCPFSSM